MPVLDATARKAISRRLIKLPTEISIFAETSTNLDEAKTAYTDVDYSNRLFLAEWITIADSYLGERQALTGQQWDTFTAAESDAAFTTAGTANKFFPYLSTLVPPLSDNFYLIPQINKFTGGQVIALDNITEENIANCFHELVITLSLGIGGGGGAVSTTLTAPYTGGVTLSVTDATNISNKSVVIVAGNDGGGVPVATDFAVYVINGGGTAGATVLDVMPIGGTSPIVVAGGGVIISTATVTWSNAVRANFPAAPYLNAATGIAVWMNSYAQSPAPSWESYLSSEHSYLTTNIDARAVQSVENATALSDTDISTIPLITALATWYALASPGPRFQDAALAVLDVDVLVRLGQVNNRISELSTAMGSVTDGGDGTYTTVAGSTAYKYEWLDRRVNKANGSLAEANNTNQSKNIVDQQYNSMVSIKANYDLVMVASPLKDDFGDLFSDMDIMADPNYEPRPLNRIQVEWLTGFSVMDSVYVIDEVHAELSGIITDLYSEVSPIQPDPNTTAYNYYMVLSFDVPLTYTADELARVYKVL